jgi:hypothetical protein
MPVSLRADAVAPAARVHEDRPMAATAAPQSGQELVELLSLIEGSDSVELKLSVPDSAQRSAVAALELDPLQAQIRQVFFFDTPDLALSKAGLAVRARRVQQKGDDTVVKLRPVVPDELPPDLRRSPNLKVEVDAMPDGHVCSASMKGVAKVDVRDTVAGRHPLRKLFTKEQRAFYAAHAPEGVALDDLGILGPIFVLKLKSPLGAGGRKLVTELWLYPDGSRILELSTKCATSEAFQAAAEARAFLVTKGIEAGGEQTTKTRKALEFFSNELRARSGAAAQ